MKSKKVIIALNCTECEAPIKIIRVGDTIEDVIAINTPGPACPDCEFDLLDKIPDPPGIMKMANLTLEKACSIILSMDFIDYEGSVQYFLKLFEDCYEMWDACAVRMHSEGMTIAAHFIIDDAIKSFPKQADNLLVSKAVFFVREEKPDDSIECLDKVINRDKVARYYTIYGNALNLKGDHSKAFECWQKSINLYPHDFMAVGCLFHYYLNITHDYKAAEKHGKKYVNIFQNNPMVYAYLGDSLFFQQKYKEAIDEYNRALEFDTCNQPLAESIQKMLAQAKSKLVKTS